MLSECIIKYSFFFVIFKKCNVNHTIIKWNFFQDPSKFAAAAAAAAPAATAAAPAAEKKEEKKEESESEDEDLGFGLFD